MASRKGSLQGGATAVNQCEGGYSEGERGSTNTDLAPADPDRFSVIAGEKKMSNFDEERFYPAQEVIDMHHRYKEDTALFGEMGSKTHRPSIAWSRISPMGDGTEPNEEGLRFHEDSFKGYHKYGTEPSIMITHFDRPIHLVEEYSARRSRKLVGFYGNLCRVTSNRYRGLVKYRLTFNKTNMILHAPFMGVGLYFEEGENKEQVKYQTAHHELLASVIVTKTAHEVDPENQVGCTLVAGSDYTYTCKPEDVFAVQQTDRESYFFIDVQSCGEYPMYALKEAAHKGIQIEMEEGDEELLREYTVDFISFSHYSPRVASTDLEINE